MHVGDILRRKSLRVVTVRMNETIGIAAKLMRANNVGAVVVQDVVHTEGNTTVGIFTDRDAVRAIADRGAAAVNMKVSQFISVPAARILQLERHTRERPRHHGPPSRPALAGHKRLQSRRRHQHPGCHLRVRLHCRQRGASSLNFYLRSRPA
jgi:hypothetical protein